MGVGLVGIGMAANAIREAPNFAELGLGQADISCRYTVCFSWPSETGRDVKGHERRVKAGCGHTDPAIKPLRRAQTATRCEVRQRIPFGDALKSGIFRVHRFLSWVSPVLSDS